MKYRMVRLGLVFLLVIAMLTSICGSAEEAAADLAGMDAPVDEASVAEGSGEEEAVVRDLAILLYNPPSSTIDFAGSISLAAAAPAGANVAWSSSDENVAEVHANGDGSVTVVGVGEGTATITCTLDNQTQTYSVTVNPPQTLLMSDVEYPSNLHISGRGWSLGRGSIASIDDLKTLTSAIKNASGDMIAQPYTQTFDGGVKSFKIREIDRYVPFGSITEAGQYIWMLTATDASGRSVTVNLPIQAVADGETIVSRAAGKCAPVIQAADGSDGGNAIALQAGEKKVLTATQLPGDAGNGVIWVSYDPAVAVVSPEGEITGVGAGTTTVICRTLDNTGFSAGYTVTVNAAAPAPEENPAPEAQAEAAPAPQGDGRNLLLNTGNPMALIKGTKDYGKWTLWNHDMPIFTDENSPVAACDKYIRLTIPAGETDWTARLMTFSLQLKANCVYTLSCWARSSNENANRLIMTIQPNAYTDWALSKTFDVSGVWQRYVSTVDTSQAKEPTEFWTAQFGLIGSPQDYEQGLDVLLAVKLEEGGVATDWTPAPEDAGNN